MSPDAHGAADHCGSRLGSGLLGCGARAPAVPLVRWSAAARAAGVRRGRVKWSCSCRTTYDRFTATLVCECWRWQGGARAGGSTCLLRPLSATCAAVPRETRNKGSSRRWRFADAVSASRGAWVRRRTLGRLRHHGRQGRVHRHPWWRVRDERANERRPRRDGSHRASAAVRRSAQP